MMLNTLTLAFLLPLLTTSQIIPKIPGPPDSTYQAGFSTQDHETPGQLGACQTDNCALAHPFPDTSGPQPLPAGVFAAAINPAMAGGACAPCGTCYEIVNSGSPLCSPNGGVVCPVAGRTGPDQQTGPSSIKIIITNHCDDCNLVDGWFDINYPPEGWNNPKIYWKQLPDAACL